MADTSFAALRARLESVPESGLEPPNVDPRAAAMAALMVADFVSKEPGRTRLVRLANVGEFDIGHVADMALAARGILQLLPRLGRVEGPASVPPVAAEVVDAARELSDAMCVAVAATSDEIYEAAGIVAYAELGDDATEIGQNLRMLAGFYAEYAEILSATTREYDVRHAAKARALARQIWAAHATQDSAERKEWRRWLLRAWGLFEHAYDEVGRAGRFLFYRERPLFKFPPLLAVATTSRRRRRAEIAAAADPPPPTQAFDEHAVLEGERFSAPPTRKVIAPAPEPEPPPEPPPPAKKGVREDSFEGILDDEDEDASAAAAPPPPSSAKAKPRTATAPARGEEEADLEVSFDQILLDENELAAIEADEEPTKTALVVPDEPPRRKATPASRTAVAAPPAKPPASYDSKEPPPALPKADHFSVRNSERPRRGVMRFPVKLKAAVNSADEIGVGATENLSETGAFVSTPVARAAGTRLVLLVSHPDTDDVLQIDAMVRWSRPARRGVGLEAGVGVEFVDVTDAQRALIKKMVGR